MSNKTVFLSYRRDTIGKAFARAIRQALTHRGYDCFLDVDAMESGPWPEQIQRQIPARAHFLLLLTPGALERCNDEKDWVRREYLLAARKKRNIVPVGEESFQPDSERQNCPAAMDGVFDLQMATVSLGNTFENDIEELIRRYIPPHKAPAGPQPSPRAIHNLPPRNPYFSGRGQLLVDLGKKLTEEGMAELQGLGGMGKTHTALEYAHRHIEEYPFLGWLRAEDPEALAEGFAALSRLLGLGTENIPDRNLVIGRVRREIEARDRGLLIFDNVESEADIRPYLPSPWRGHILITSRSPALGLVRDSLSPEEFTLEEAEELLKKHLDPEHPEALAELLAELGGLPLALEQARAYLRETGSRVGQYLALFRGHRPRLLAHRAPGSQAEVTVATTWELAFQRVVEEMPEAEAFLNLCAFLAPEDIPRRFFRAGVEHVPEQLAARVTDDWAFDRLIGLLRRHALLETQGEALSFHRLVQTVLVERLAAAEKDEWLARTIRVLDAGFPFERDNIQTWLSSAQLVPHVNAIWEHCKRRTFTNAALGHLLYKTGLYLSTRGEYLRCQTLFEATLEISRAVFGEKHPETAKRLDSLAVSLYSLGQYTEAQPLLKQALEMRRSAFGNAHPDTAISLNNLGLLLYAQGQYAKAKHLIEQSLEIRRTVFGEDHPRTATSLNNLARLLYAQGQYTKAKHLHESALRIKRATLGETHPLTANSLSNLAKVLSAQGQYAEAWSLHQKALSIRRTEFGEMHPNTATSLNNLALLLYAQGKYDKARPLLEKSLRIRQFVFRDMHPRIATSLNHLGLLLFKQGKEREAVSHLEQALAIQEAVLPVEHPDILESLYNLGLTCLETGEFDKARGYLTRARQIKERHPEYPRPSLEEIEGLLAKVSPGSGTNENVDI
uniref:Tetratricopeptide repeat-containing protein n=1 Tax=Candidatus Kentrum sp. FW TaxID=2126338 RepID=A0A450SL28_9GAMM|nr:MAG: Tetratricopeptide repeat-containing protein [Candidatus Kentron sp. FW]